MTYQEAKTRQDALYAESARASRISASFPKGPMNLTPDHVKAAPEWRAAKAAADKAFAELRAFNGWFTKTYRKEIAADRKARR